MPIKWPKTIAASNGNTSIAVLLNEDGSGSVTVDRDERRVHRHDLTKEMPVPDPQIKRSLPRTAHPV